MQPSPTSPSRRHSLSALAVSAAGLGFPGLLRAQGNTVHVGLTLPLSGLVRGSNEANSSNLEADTGLEYLAGFKAAIAAETRGSGSPVEVIALDDAFKPEQARANVEELIKRGAVSVSGLWTAEGVAACMPLLRAQGLPAVGMRTGVPELRSPHLREMFHLRAGLHDEIATHIRTMKTASVSRWGVVHAPDAVGRATLLAMKQQGAEVARAVSVASAQDMRAAAREVVNGPGVQAILVAGGVDMLSRVVIELRHRDNPYVMPICALSNSLSASFSISNDRNFVGVAITSPLDNPLTSRAAVAQRFRDAMLQMDLDHATRSFSGFEGFLAGSVLGRTIAQMRGSGPIRRDNLTAALRSRPMDLGGLPVAFDEQQVGLKKVHLLFKSAGEGMLRS